MIHYCGLSRHSTRRLQTLCVGAASILPAFGIFLCFRVDEDPILAGILYGTIKFFLVLFPIIVNACLLQKPFSLRLGKGCSLPQSLLEGCIGGIVMSGLLLLGMTTSIGDVVFQSASIISKRMASFGVEEQEHFLAFALLISLANSMLEEYYWRGFVYGSLRQIVPQTWAHGLAGAAFSLHHIVICAHLFPTLWGWILGSSVAAGGILWSLMYERHQILYGAWLSHLIVDLAMMHIGSRLIFS